MNQILKRLEIIKSSIAIEDEEIIELQIIKLEKIDIDDEVRNILKYLQNSDFSTAIRLIENYLSKYSGIVEYIDPQIQGLKLELKSLEEKLQNLVIEKTEYLNDIEEFNTQYNIHLGDIIKSILSLKKELLYKKTIKYQKIKDNYEEEIKTFNETTETISELKETISELEEALENIDKDDESYDEIYKAYQELQEELKNLEDELYSQKQKLDDTKEQLADDELFNEYEDVKSAYDEFENEYEHIKDTQKDINKLNDDEKIEIKKLYKKAARLCHPDIVSDELKEKAHEIMQALNDAYSKKDITKVKEILLNLETGKSFELSSDSIEDKEILKAKIEEFKKTIQELKNEIEEIKSDDTFITISSLDDWDEYFEDLRRDLEEEKEKLVFESKEILEEKKEVEEWIRNLWDWADKNNISNGKLSRKKENLLVTTTIDLTDVKLNYLAKEITYLKNLQELILWGCYLKYLPKDIVKLDKLRKLNLRGNPELSASPSQFHWIDELSKKSTVFKDSIRTVREETVDMFAGEAIEKTKETIKQVKEEFRIIQKENSDYSKYIQFIENIKFEKIRKYCENLSRDNSADDMQKYLGLNGKMHKALIYSSLEVFIEELNGKNITLIDWGCDQGIASMLVLDYIKEKQLNIKVEDIILCDTDDKLLSRAISQVEALNLQNSKIIAINSKDNDTLDILKTIKNNITLNIFANDIMPIDYFEIDYSLLNQAYFMCLSNDNEEFVDEIYENISVFTNIQDISIRDGNIGRFSKHERIFKVVNLVYEQLDKEDK